MSYLKLLRVSNWVKNFFIFLPLFFAADIFNLPKLTAAFLTFLAFSLVASFVYVVNDTFDIEYDRKHPTKKNRPMASGKISVRNGLIVGVMCILGGLALMLTISKIAFYLTLFYFFLNLAYSIKLKHIAILDFVIVALGFVIRIIIGADVTDIPMSQWMLVMIFLLSIFLAVSKRRDDVYQFEVNAKINRKVVTSYNLAFMDKIITIVSSVLIVSYLLFVTSEEVIERYQTKWLFATLIFVLIGIFRYNQITYVYNKSGSPVKILFKDLFLQICLFLWFLSFFIIIYFNEFLQWIP